MYFKDGFSEASTTSGARSSVDVSGREAPKGAGGRECALKKLWAESMLENEVTLEALQKTW
jgi:hypothetical protein